MVQTYLQLPYFRRCFVWGGFFRVSASTFSGGVTFGTSPGAPKTMENKGFHLPKTLFLGTKKKVFDGFGALGRESFQLNLRTGVAVSVVVAASDF